MNTELYQKLFAQVAADHVSNKARQRNDRVLVCDGTNLFIRNWSTCPTMNDDGEHVGGLVGSLNSIGALIRQFNPTRVIIVFDGKGGSDVRKKLFNGYKSDRGKNRFRVNRQYPEMLTEEQEHLSMRQQFMWLVDLLDSLPITTMVYDGVEADDVIAYIAKHCKEMNSECIMVSTDKDFLQLVDDRTFVYSPTQKIMYNRQEVYNKYGIWPQNLLLFRTLDGDVSDTIPGVNGAGLKTVLKRLPELSEDTEVTFDDMFLLCENRIGKIKLFSDILNEKDTVLLNQQLMQLSEPMIPGIQKLRILGRFDEENKQFDKMDFIHSAAKYKILNSWRDISVWLRETWTNILVK